MEKIPEWIYAPTNFSPELEKTFAAVEKALGFKLFIWQKTFIANTAYRRSGRTTAEILRDLLNVSKPPLDYTKPVADHMERFYREETREIKAKLDAAGIPTRTVFFSRQEKENITVKRKPGSRRKIQYRNLRIWKEDMDMKTTAEMTLGSLFDGIAGFPLAASRQGIKTVWVSEIEPNCIDIAKRHFPEAIQLGDITQIDGAKIPVVDIISFGSPCQDLSVAGKQTGLDGSRSGLFMEAVRITREMREKTNGQYPKYIIWENVAGAFSSNKGEDFRRVLEEITQSNISMPKSGKWATAGMVGNEGPGGTFSVPHGDCLTLNFGECPNVENVSTLSMILEMDVPDKYFLSAKACWGIIRRAEQRNKEIPVILKIALLERIAEEWQRTQTDK